MATVKGEKRELRVSGILDRQEEQLFSTFPAEVNQLVATNVSNPLFAGSDYMYLSAIANDTSRLSEISAEIESKLGEDDDQALMFFDFFLVHKGMISHLFQFFQF